MGLAAFLIGLLIIMSSIACFAGWVWLVVRAFKTSVGWGLAMLFFAPVTAIVAAVKDWENWKKPFLLYWGSAGLQTAVIVVTLVALPFALPFAVPNEAQAEFAQAMEQAQREAAAHAEGTVDATAENRAQPMAPAVDAGQPATELASNAENTDSVDSSALVDPTGKPAQAVVTDRTARAVRETAAIPSGIEVEPGFEEIAVAAAAARAGSKVRLFDLDGRLHAGVLRGVENGALIVAFDLGAGIVTTAFEPKEIKSLQVAVPVVN